MSIAAADDPALSGRAATRWVQLLLGLLCMMAISSPQYVWALFTKPLAAQLGASAAGIQVTFSLLIVLQTFFSPAQGWLIERFGPRWLIALGAALTGLSWVLAAQAGSLWGLWLTYGLLGGIGTGIVYVGVVGLMMAWVPERRGFAAGVVAAGYGIGAILTTFPISDSLASAGLDATLRRWGLILGAAGAAAALGLRPPPTRPATDLGSGRSVPTGVMLRLPLFWLMFAMMAMMSTSGLMVTSQIGVLAADFGVAKALVWGMAALPLALTIDRFCNGLTRPFFGWVSDQIGREETMALAFALEGVAMAAWLALRHDPLLFTLLSGVVFFGWGEIFSLFPSTLTDTFGTSWATRNYGCLYLAQGIGAVFGGPLASLLHAAAGSWTPVFAVAIATDLLTAALALAALKPMRRAFLAQGAG
jgi:OFA family oxalate/formate antiporter-like MFS transporter